MPARPTPKWWCYAFGGQGPLWVKLCRLEISAARLLYPGEFNRSVQHQLQSIGRGFEGQGLSRALIEPQSNGIEVGLGEAREIGSSREVLSQQAVGVLVAATLPWTARITEVNLHVGGNREAFVARHLLALVPRQGAS